MPQEASFILKWMGLQGMRMEQVPLHSGLPLKHYLRERHLIGPLLRKGGGLCMNGVPITSTRPPLPSSMVTLGLPLSFSIKR